MSERYLSGYAIIVGFILIIAVQFALVACQERNQGRSVEQLAAEVSLQTAVTYTPSVTPSPTLTAEATRTSLPTPVPTATTMPEVEVFVPEYLRRNVLEAVHGLESKGTQRRWKLAESDLQADIVLEPGDMGILAGSRPVAITVPFESPWEDVSSSEAERIAMEPNADVAIMDWAIMSPDRRALRVDGSLPSAPDYPVLQNWSLITSQDHEMAALELAQHLRRTINHDPLIHLTAVGDLMMDRAIGYAIENGDLTFPFAAVTSALEQADLTVGNLESALGDRGQPENKSYTFQAPPAAADALALAGFDLVSLANNHALDYGPGALQQAMQLLEQQDIATVGAGPDVHFARKPFTFEHEGMTLTFLSYVDVPVEVSGFDTRNWSATDERPGVAWAVEADIADDVSAAKLESDLVVVLLHSGYEYVQTPSPEQIAAAQAAIDAGADLVLGHHAHVLQGLEFHGDSVIVYGLGNFAFEIDGDPTTMILDAWLDSDGVRQIQLTPAIIEAGGRPRIAAPWEASEIRQRVHYLSSFLNGEQ